VLLNRILQAICFAVMLVCIAIVLELLLVGFLEAAFQLRVRPGIWMVLFPIVLGIFGFRIGVEGGVIGLLLRAGATYGTAIRLSYAWVAGFVVWGIVVWAMVERCGPFVDGPFGEYRWDAGQWLLFTSIVSGPPLLAVILMWLGFRVRRGRA
jgi:hypothetical protein